MSTAAGPGRSPAATRATGEPTLRPLVVTLVLDPDSQARFDAERAAFFPADRLLVGAHVTLFHALPGQHEDHVRDDLHAAARRPRFPVRVEEVVRLGRGVAYRLTSPALLDLHAVLRAAWRDWLTAQDRQPFRPHVTVQNKVDSATARATFERLAACFRPAQAQAHAVALWRYEGGPWTPLTVERFDPNR